MDGMDRRLSRMEGRMSVILAVMVAILAGDVALLYHVLIPA